MAAKNTAKYDLCEEYKRRIDELRPFPAETAQSLREYYRIGLSYSSNALEGNSLTESETKVVIEDGLSVGGKPLRDVFEAVGHAEAYDFLYNFLDAEPLKLETILTLHRLFYARIDAANAGTLRKIRVYITGSSHRLPAPERVPALMDEFIVWFNENEPKLHPVEFAALAHQKFVFIHPFVDGNGRVARLLMNLALLRAGYLIAIIPPILRHEYIGLLERARSSAVDFCAFIADRVAESQKDLLRLCGKNLRVGSPRALHGGINENNDGGLNDRERAIAGLLRKRAGLNALEIAAELNISLRTTQRALHNLTSSRFIEFRGAKKNGGYYVLPRSAREERKFLQK